jgi:hypothetical protein
MRCVEHYSKIIFLRPLTSYFIYIHQMTKVALLLATLAIFLGTEAHVRMMAPTSRSSLWRVDQFKPFNPPENYNDDGLYCGRVHQWPEVSNCGLCGDPVDDPRPRDNEHGGLYGQGVISANYSAGQVR